MLPPAQYGMHGMANNYWPGVPSPTPNGDTQACDKPIDIAIIRDHLDQIEDRTIAQAGIAEQLCVASAYCLGLAGQFDLPQVQ